MQNIVIGIEGEVASGKTSICRELIDMIDNCIFIDGGAIYRGIIVAIMQLSEEERNDIKNKLSSIDALEVMKKLKVDFKIENKETVVYIDGNKIENDKIQNAKNAINVTTMASIADNSGLFKFAKNIIDSYRSKYNIIVSARDLVEIYPDMSCHIYITASLEERVNRRYKQYNEEYTKEQIKEMIIKRDEIHNISGFNTKCNKSVVIDVTECKSAKDSANKVLDKLEELKLV